MRELEAAGTPEAEQAIDYFVFRIRREFGGLAASCRASTRWFSAAASARIPPASAAGFARICIGSASTWTMPGTRGTKSLVSTASSRAKIFVIKTDEEAMIARHTFDLIKEKLA